MSVEKLVQAQIQSGCEEGVDNVYTNETRGTVSFSASCDRQDHIIYVHTAKLLLPPEQEGWSLVPPVNAFWLLQTPKAPQVLSGKVLRGQTKNVPGMVLLLLMNSVLM